MNKTLLISMSNVISPEKDEEFNTWFNEVHGPEAIALPGFRSFTRYRVASQVVPPAEKPTYQYFAIYEVDDAERCAKALLDAAPNLSMIDALDMPTAMGLMCEEIYTTRKDRREENKVVARRLIETLGALDTQGFLDCLADDVVFETPGQFALAGSKTKTDLAKEFPAMRDVIPGGLKFTIDTITAEDDRVHVELSGESKTVDGRDYNNKYHYAMIIRDGKVVRFRDYLDSDLAMKVLGQSFEEHGATYFGRDDEKNAQANAPA
ncbi:nuclear transport factor 2 family protein [Sphingobium sp.]|uniref:nuclear transport factor 2 family protein n=1 Tax=Sphingobium sp. TaxID=1912891 RepID=UPI0028BDF217|nr:nuclear transport factor 2 family protein [Sphingobium sp.]